MKNIYLVGFMGTGKTAIGRQLAKRLNYDFRDLDLMIENKEKRPIVRIFAEDGEAYFRKIEKEVLKDVAGLGGMVVACGGGIVLDEDNIALMKETGDIICLKANVKTILKRTRGFKHRPLLNVRDPGEKIRELLKFREPFYKQADYSIDTSELSINDVVEKILRDALINKVENSE